MLQPIEDGKMEAEANLGWQGVAMRARPGKFDGIRYGGSSMTVLQDLARVPRLNIRLGENTAQE